MKIVIAGGLGFIGHVVTIMLVEQGHECTVIDSFEDYGILNNNELVDIFAERWGLLGKTKVIHSDVSKYSDIQNADVIVNLASFPRAKAVDLNPARASSSMHVGTVKLCEAANQYSAKMLFISSSMVYGDWQEQFAKETHTPNPKGLYALMKFQGEQLVRTLCPDNHIIIRPSAVYGPRDVTDRVVSLMFKAAMSGNPIKVEGPYNLLDFTYVDDIAKGIVSAILSDVKNVTVNMSRGESKSLLDLAGSITSITNSNSHIELADHNTRYPRRGAQDISLAKSLFGFNPTTDLYTGLGLYYDWLKTR